MRFSWRFSTPAASLSVSSYQLPIGNSSSVVVPYSQFWVLIIHIYIYIFIYIYIYIYHIIIAGFLAVCIATSQNHIPNIRVLPKASHPLPCSEHLPGSICFQPRWSLKSRPRGSWLPWMGELTMVTNHKKVRWSYKWVMNSIVGIITYSNHS